MKELTQNQTAEPIIFLMIDSAAHINGKTGLSPTVTISKNGGAFASPAGAVTEIGNGLYKIAGNATDTDTLGPLWVHASSAGADPVDDCYQVVAVNARLASYGLSLAKTTNVTGFNDIAATDVVSAGAITTLSGAVVNVDLVDVLTTYTGNTVQTGDAFARIGAPAGASVSADILVLDNLVDDLESRLGTPSNLGSGATVAANLVDIEGQTDDIGVAGAGLTALGDTRLANLNATVSSRMATYTQPTGFLAATFPGGTLANTTNITAGTITTATNVTTVNGLAASTVTASALATDAVTEIQSGLATTANVSAVETDTQDIQSRLPAALAGGFMKSDVLAINGSTLAAVITAAINGSLKTGTVDDATFAPTSTVFETDITTNSDEFTKQTILWTGGLNAGMFVRVLSYAFANSKVKLTLSEALPNVPVDGDTFAVTSRIE